MNKAENTVVQNKSLAYLDVFRGLAAVLMLVNHAGYRLLAESAISAPSLTGAIIFLGSFAPVLFFFSTGFGIGLSASHPVTSSVLLSALWKGGLLLLADQFFWYSHGLSANLDFFGFIGITTTLITLLAISKRSIYLSVGLIFVLLFVRFIVGPLLHSAIPNITFINWVVGYSGLSQVSYSLSPWIIYPLVGFVFAKTNVLEKLQTYFPRLRFFLKNSILILLCLLLSLIFYWLGKPFYRWGTMSLGYFILSIAVLGIFFSTAKFISSCFPFSVNIFSLRGVSSYLVIPIHYALLELYVFYGQTPISIDYFYLIAFALTFFSFGLARFGVTVVAPGAANQKKIIFFVGVILIFIFSFNHMLPAVAKDNENVIRFLGQVLIACMLVLRPPFQRKWHGLP